MSEVPPEAAAAVAPDADVHGATANAAAHVDDHTPSSPAHPEPSRPQHDVTDGSDRLDTLEAMMTTLAESVTVLTEQTSRLAARVEPDRTAQKPPWTHRGGSGHHE